MFAKVLCVALLGLASVQFSAAQMQGSEHPMRSIPLDYTAMPNTNFRQPIYEPPVTKRHYEPTCSQNHHCGIVVVPAEETSLLETAVNWVVWLIFLPITIPFYMAQYVFNAIFR